MTLQYTFVIHVYVLVTGVLLLLSLSLSPSDGHQLLYFSIPEQRVKEEAGKSIAYPTVPLRKAPGAYEANPRHGRLHIDHSCTFLLASQRELR